MISIVIVIDNDIDLCVERFESVLGAGDISYGKYKKDIPQLAILLNQVRRYRFHAFDAILRREAFPLSILSTFLSFSLSIG